MRSSAMRSSRRPDFLPVEESREIILTNRALSDRAISEIHDHVNVETRHGVFLTAVKRMGRDLPLLAGLKLKTGDELHFTGSTADLDRVQSKIGYKISAAAATDFIFFGIGMVVGMLIGMIAFKIWGVPISIGSGGGCLLSGLLFGWLRSVHPRFAALPMGASNFLRDFGLAVFVGIVGIGAGPQALVAIEQYGLTLLFLGVGGHAHPADRHVLFLLLRPAHPKSNRGAGLRRRRPQRQSRLRRLARQGRQRHAGRFLHRHLRGRQRLPHPVGAGHRRHHHQKRRPLTHLRSNQYVGKNPRPTSRNSVLSN